MTGTFSAAAAAIGDANPGIDDYEADTRALKLLCGNQDARAIARVLGRRTVLHVESSRDVDGLTREQRDELLEDYWRLLGLTAAGPVDALVRSLLGDSPDAADVDDPDVVAAFRNARAAVQRAFERCELRAAALLAVSVARRGGRSNAA